MGQFLVSGARRSSPDRRASTRSKTIDLPGFHDLTFRVKLHAKPRTVIDLYTIGIGDQNIEIAVWRPGNHNLLFRPRLERQVFDVDLHRTWLDWCRRACRTCGWGRHDGNW